MKYGLALGANLGDRREKLLEARDRLVEISSNKSSLLSAGIYETAPVDCAPGDPPFLNTCLELDFNLSARELHDHTRAIETALGRSEPRATNAPRCIDIDILYAGEKPLTMPGLTIPHPRLTERRFVLVPLNDIRPDLVLPDQDRNIATLLHELQSAEPPLALVTKEW